MPADLDERFAGLPRTQHADGLLVIETAAGQADAFVAAGVGEARPG